MKTLVAFFSAQGRTKKKAIELAEKLGADIYEIKPLVEYKKEDLNWMNKKSRTTIEMNDPASRPEMADIPIDISQYNEIYIGFPIWWYVAPHIINTFLEKYDFSNKTIKLFATSGGSGFGNTVNELKISAPNADFKECSINNKIL